MSCQLAMPCFQMDTIQSKLPFTLAFRLPSEALKLISCYHRKLNGLCERFDPIESAHLTVKYLGYSSPSFTEDDVFNLLPKISDISKKYIPLKIYIRGIDIFCHNEAEERVFYLVYLKVLPNPELERFHADVMSSLGSAIDAFPHADGPNFKPHITISKGVPQNNVDRIKKLIVRSRKTCKRMYKMDELVVFTPTVTLPVRAC